MPSPTELISAALSALERRHGFTERASQRQLALLIGDLIEGGTSGVFEAPTGIGKSLAALIPALAHSSLSGKRIVIATYTNVLAEQYWKKDVPLALELIADLTPLRPDVRLIMGRQRYSCLVQLAENDRDLRDQMLAEAHIGHESDFRRISKLPTRAGNAMWPKIAVPVVCPGRLCPDYSRCFYYSARRAAAKAGVVITNHSVVVQDALMKAAEGSEGLLGEIDFLILDEAHDFPLAAANGLEFELNTSKMQTFIGIGVHLGRLLGDLASSNGLAHEWQVAVRRFEEDSQACARELQAVGARLQRPGIVTASPDSLSSHDLVKQNLANLTTADITDLGRGVERCCETYSTAIDKLFDRIGAEGSAQADAMKETIRNYRRYLDELAGSIHALIAPRGVSVTHASQSMGGAKIRSDTIGLAEPLHELIWSHCPTACLSATLAVDNNFEFFSSAIGLSSAYEEVLSAPFDYSVQAALYLPPDGAVPDPTLARKQQSEPEYYRAVAAQIRRIIEVCQGRTLVLFHSRKEMEGVAALIPSSAEFPILIQTPQGTADVGERFKEVGRSSLFALRSFWTGFDAPGETLSCVVIVRVPFEVPIDPPQIARAAHLSIQGLNPFAHYTLPMAKILIRQGVGRLIRGPEDRGVIAILDPRLRTKRYGEEILDNLPAGMRTYRSIEEAADQARLTPATTLF